MTSIKLQRAYALCNLAGMPVTRNAIQQELDSEAETLAWLTSKQLAAVIRLVQHNYHKGRATTGAEVVDGDALWIGAGVDKLIPLDALRALSVEKNSEVERIPYTGGYVHLSDIIDSETGKRLDRQEVQYRIDDNDPRPMHREQHWSVTRYRLDYQERI